MTDTLARTSRTPEQAIESMFDSVSDAFSESPAVMVNRRIQAASKVSDGLQSTQNILMRSVMAHAERISREHQDRFKESLATLSNLTKTMSESARGETLGAAWQAYVKDASQRFVLTLDTLRERGDIFLSHEAAGCPPVLTYDYEVVVDGADLATPCNYMLLRILPPEGVKVDDRARPYVIVDPRAGHGAGIGGFKSDSQVGVALSKGHPVYFVAFRRDPIPGQSLADVTHAEAEFVREVARRHPDAPKPVVTGNCQGGWATLLLAATNHDLTGPIVLNGAPVSTWAGEVGKYPMRYNGGVLGGTWQPMFWSDIGDGVFDGAHLVLNFELLNPSRNYFGKYYDLYRKADTERQRFLDFEKWWGGFFLLNEAEIHWIVEQLFVGNRLAKNEAQLEPGRHIDIKNIRSPIIVFASHGDNITPPQQALNWIVDTYADASEIQIRGQRIIYIVHDQVGHLGIFVSSKIAKREHSEMTGTMEAIESLPPGLYEMTIDDYHGHGEAREFTVSFHERSLDDLRKLDDKREDEKPFAAVARVSEVQAQLYDLYVRPYVKAVVNPGIAELTRMMHPLRLQRGLMSSRNPMMSAMPDFAEKVKAEREPAASDNPFVQFENVWASLFEQSIDFVRDMRDAMYENMFFLMWSTPWASVFGQPYLPGRTLKNKAELRALPEVQSALYHMTSGGFAEAVIRMLILLAESRGEVRRDRLERSSTVLTEDEPFRSLSIDQRRKIIDEQTLVVEFERDAAISTLADLLRTPEDRKLAAEVAQYVPGSIDEMSPSTLEMLQRFREVLNLSPISGDITKDPLKARGFGTLRGGGARIPSAAE
jgi:pimeloyl-ACP methyl ester carboxylesterase